MINGEKLALLIPRLAFIGSSSLHGGYDALGRPVRSAARVADRPIATNGVWAAWPLAFGSAPGAYIGAVMLLAIAFAWPGGACVVTQISSGLRANVTDCISAP